MQYSRSRDMIDTMARACGIDYGARRIGVALSDERFALAFPFAIITNDVHAPTRMRDIITKEQVTVIVCGASVTLKGDDNPIMAPARQFAEMLSKITNLPLVFIPEHFTTAHARRQHDAPHPTRTPRRRQVVDDSAAALILQHYLDTTTTHPHTH